MESLRYQYLKRFFGEARIGELEVQLFEQAHTFIDVIEQAYLARDRTLVNKKLAAKALHRMVREDFLNKAFETITSEVEKNNYTLEEARAHIILHIIPLSEVLEHYETEARSLSAKLLARPLEIVSKTIWAYEPVSS